MARSAKKAAVSPETRGPDIERPPQPRRFKASKEQMLQFYREMLLIRPRGLFCAKQYREINGSALEQSIEFRTLPDTIGDSLVLTKP